MQTIYLFVFEKINQNKVMSGSNQHSKRKIFVLVPEKLASWNNSYHKCALVYTLFKKYSVLPRHFRLELLPIRRPGLWNAPACLVKSCVVFGTFELIWSVYHATIYDSSALVTFSIVLCFLLYWIHSVDAICTFIMKHVTRVKESCLSYSFLCKEAK